MKAQCLLPPAERQMCAPDVDTEATQELAWRVPRDVAPLFAALRETLRARLRGERGRAPDGLVFELGLRPGAPPLVRYRSGDISVPEAGASSLACPPRAA